MGKSYLLHEAPLRCNIRVSMVFSPEGEKFVMFTMEGGELEKPIPVVVSPKSAREIAALVLSLAGELDKSSVGVLG